MNDDMLDAARYAVSKIPREQFENKLKQFVEQNTEFKKGKFTFEIKDKDTVIYDGSQSYIKRFKMDYESMRDWHEKYSHIDSMDFESQYMQTPVVIKEFAHFTPEMIESLKNFNPNPPEERKTYSSIIEHQSIGRILRSNQQNTINMDTTKLQRGIYLENEIRLVQKKLDFINKSESVSSLNVKYAYSDQDIDVSLLDQKLLKRHIVSSYERHLKKLKKEFADL